MHEQQIEQIKDAIREMMQLLSGRGTVNNEIRRAIANAIEHAAQRITQLRQEQTILGGHPPLPPTPPLDPAPHPSSNINAFRYDPESQRLYIKFQGDFPQENGPVYQYEGVPKNIFNIIQRGSVAPRTSGSNAWHTWKEGITPSHGASVYALIREGGYPYQRLS